MDTGEFISLIRPPVREYVNKVGKQAQGTESPTSVLVECQMTDNDGSSKVGKSFNFNTKIVPHPSKNKHQYPFGDVFKNAAEAIVEHPETTRSYSTPEGEANMFREHDPEVHRWEQKLFEFSWKVMDYEGDHSYSDEAFMTALSDHFLVHQDQTYRIIIPLLNVSSNLERVLLHVEESKVHPHENNPFVIKNLSVERFSDPELSAVLTYEGFLSDPSEELYASSFFSFNNPSYKLAIEFDSIYKSNFGLRSSRIDNSTISRPLLEKSRGTAERVLSAMRLDDPTAKPGYSQSYLVKPDWRTYRDDINSLDLYRPWDAGYDPSHWSPALTGSSYSITEVNKQHFQRFWQRYSPAISFEEGDRFERSLSRFNEIYNRSNPKDQLVDAVIVFEGLLSKGCEIGGLGTTMALIGSILLETRSKLSRDDLRSFFRTLYFVRGEIVHKDETWDSIIQDDRFEFLKGEDPSIQDFSKQTREILSHTILAVVANTISLFSRRRDFFVPILPLHMSYLTR